MEFTAQQIAEFIEGEIVGDGKVKLNKVSKIEEGEEGALSFLANPKYTKHIYTSKASAVIVNQDFCPEKEVQPVLIKVKDAYTAFASLLEMVHQFNYDEEGIDETAKIDDSCKLGEELYIGHNVYIGKNCVIGNNVRIYPGCFIGKNVSIGNDTTLWPGVKIYNDCKIGENCIFHGGVIIGSDGFGFAPDSENYKKIPQIGNVIIEDRVEIGSNTTIDRATMGSTYIRKGVKLDNLIQVAHNVDIGENTVIAAQTGISGSTKIGKNCMIGGQVGIVGHIEIADEVKIAAQSGVGKSIKKKGAIVQGSPSYDIKDYQKSYVLYKKLPDLYKKISTLEQELKEVKEALQVTVEG